MNIFICTENSDFSLLDGYGFVEEYAARIPKIGQKFLTITDHGMCAAFPRLIRACEENHINPLFGCELYINPLQPELKEGESTGDLIKDLNEEDKKKIRKSYHLIAIANNNVGYSNLVKLSSWAWLKGFYYHPRINHEVLKAHREGITFSSACYMGEIGQMFDECGEEAAIDLILKYKDMLGDFYLELMLLDFVKQKPYNAFLVRAHLRTGIPLIVTCDTHFAEKDDAIMQRYMLMIQTGRTFAEVKAEVDAANGDTSKWPFEWQDDNLWLKSEEELNQKWLSDYQDVIPLEIFEEAKRNTVRIAERAKGVTLDRSIKLPKIPDCDRKLNELVMEGFIKRNLPKTQEYLDRIKEEYQLITAKEFSSYFLIQKMMVDEARRWWAEKTGGDGYGAVGPGRGSAAGSLICYCLGITDVDPIKHDLLFSRFLSPARGGKQMKLRFKKKPIYIED